MSQTITLETEAYNDFLRCLVNLKEICNDVDIRGGFIRQRSNDLTSIFEMDLTSLIGDAQLPITNLKKKLDLLKTFAGQSVTIEIEEGETESESYFIFADEQSSIKFQFPAIEFMDNKMMTQEELDNIFNLDEEDLILDDALNNVITERIRIITDNFNTQAIQVKFENDLAKICAATQSKDQFANFKTDIPTNIDFGGNFNSNLSTIPFGIEHDTDLDFRMYKDPQQNVSLNQIKTELGPVSINIFSRSAIVEEEE
jgi:hypothetical protein